MCEGCGYTCAYSAHLCMPVFCVGVSVCMSVQHIIHYHNLATFLSLYCVEGFAL